LVSIRDGEELVMVDVVGEITKQAVELQAKHHQQNKNKKVKVQY
jgi:hypothetical protein